MTDVTTSQVTPERIRKLIYDALFFKDVPLPDMLDGDFELHIKVFEDEDGVQTSFHLVGYTGDTAQALRDARRKDRERESAFRLQEANR